MYQLLRMLLLLLLPLLLPLASNLHAARAAQQLAPKLLHHQWTPFAPYPLRVFEAAGGVLRTSRTNHTLIVAGGYVANSGLRATTRVHALALGAAPAAAQWQPLADMPQPLTHCAQALVNHTLYLCGGFLSTAPGRSVRSCMSFSLRHNRWRALPPLPVSAGGGAMVYVAPLHALLYAGGMRREPQQWGGQDSRATFLLPLRQLRRGWLRQRPMPNARNHMAAAAAASRYLFLGGQHSADELRGNQRTLNQFDVRSGAWRARAQLPRALGHVAASSFAFWNGVLVVGGVLNGRQHSDELLYYDALADAWSVVGRFARRVQSPVCGASHRRVFCTTGLGSGAASLSYYTPLSTPVAVQA